MEDAGSILPRNIQAGVKNQLLHLTSLLARFYLPYPTVFRYVWRARAPANPGLSLAGVGLVKFGEIGGGCVTEMAKTKISQTKIAKIATCTISRKNVKQGKSLRW